MLVVLIFHPTAIERVGLDDVAARIVLEADGVSGAALDADQLPIIGGRGILAVREAQFVPGVIEPTIQIGATAPE